jgi:hypothetical protein
MQLNRGTQYQGYPETLTVKGYNYQSSPTGKKTDRKTFYFDNPTEWTTGAVAVGNLAPTTQTGVELYQGVTDSALSATAINTYNPLTTVTRDTTKPSYLLNNQNYVKVVNTDFSASTAFKFTAKGSTANDQLIIRYYTGAGVADYYQVVCAMPIPNVEYTFNFNPFINGSYGAVSAPTIVGAKSYATGLATVTSVGSPTGQIINRINLFGVSTVASSKITPIALEGANSSLNIFGQKFQIPVCCLDSLTEELTRTYKELMCGKNKNGKSLDTQEEKITFKIQKNNILLRALGYGSEVYDTLLDVSDGKTKLTLVNASPNIIANISGAITMSLANGTNIDYISIDKAGDCIALQRDYVKNTSATLDSNSYYVDLANNRIIFSNDIFNYGEVEVATITTKTVSVFDHYTKNNPVKVVLEWTVKNVAGTRTRFRRVVAELGYPKDSVEDTGNTTEFECTVLLTDYNQSIEGEF